MKKHQKIRARSTFASKPQKARFIRSLRCDQLEERNLLTAIYTDVIDDDEGWYFSDGNPNALWSDNAELLDETIPGLGLTVQRGDDFPWSHAFGNYRLEKTFPGITWQPGNYVFEVDVFTRQDGSWLTPHVGLGSHGPTADGDVIVDAVWHAPSTVSGNPWLWTTWYYGVTVESGDSVDGKSMGFEANFSLTTTGELGFDDLRVTSCNVVTSTNDSGPGSLRHAIECSNSEPGVDTIEFALTGNGPHVIQPESALPTITDPVIIDGYSQLGSSPNTAARVNGSNANLQIVLDGSLAGGGANGLTITSGDSTVEGLVIQNFAGSGIELTSVAGNRIAGNFIGTDVTGTLSQGNDANGIRINSSSSAPSGEFAVTSFDDVASSIGASGIRFDDYFPHPGGNLVNFGSVSSTVFTNPTTGATPFGLVSTGDFADGTSFVTTVDIAGGGLYGAPSTVEWNFVDPVTADPQPVKAVGFRYGGLLAPLQAEFFDENNNLIDTVDLEIDSYTSNSPVTSTSSAGFISVDNPISKIVFTGEPGLSQFLLGSFSHSAGLLDVVVSDGFSSPNVIGTDGDGNNDVAEMNVIGGNGLQNVLIFGSSSNSVIAGNLIGVNATGTGSLANSNVGIDISDGSNRTRIGTDGNGTSDSLEGNVISGNVTAGVRLRGTPSVSDTIIAGNIIGADASGISSVANSGVGIQLSRATNTRIGTNGDGQSDVEERNVISGNAADGVLISGQPQTGTSPGENILAGNYIGIGTTLNSLPNGTNGVRIGTDNSNNRVGSNNDTFADSAEQNIIANNGGAGIVVIGTTTGNTFSRNSIFNNGLLGIDLGNNGVTANDTADFDVGENNLQNYPVINSVVSTGSTVSITGTLESVAGQPFTVEFFSNSNTPGEGEKFLGSANVVTNGFGTGSFSETFVAAVPAGHVISATATDALGNTSEFSATAVVIESEVEFAASSFADPESVGTSSIVELVRSNPNGVSEVSVSILGGAAIGGGTDYDDSNFPLSVTFNNGETSKQISIPITQENLVELNEDIILSVSATSGAAIGSQSSTTLSILNDDAATVTIANAQVIEGDGPGNSQLVFDVTLNNPVDVPISMTYQTIDGTATLIDSDYVPANSLLLNFLGQANEIQQAVVDVVGDDESEFDETLSVQLSDLQASGRNVTLAGSGLGTIINDDFAPIPNDGGPYLILEGQSLTLDASGTTDADSASLTYRWDVDGNGDFNEGVLGQNPTVSWSTLASLGINDGPDGPRVVSLEVSDGTNTSVSSTTLSVQNDDPNAANDSGVADEDGPSISIDVLANDSDPAGANDPLTLVSVDNTGTLGTIMISGGMIVYDPNGQFEFLDAGDIATDTFTYTISDGDGGTASASVTVDIHGENDAPVVANPIDDVMASEDAVDDVLDVSGVFADPDADDVLTLSVIGNTNSALVAAAIIGNSLVLDYQPDQSGAADITVRATDQSGEFVETTFSVTVLSASDQLQNILTKVQGFSGVNTNGLESKLQGALTKVGNGQNNAAANQINAFINQLNDFVSSGSVDALQAAECIDAAIVAITSINTGNGST